MTLTKNVRSSIIIGALIICTPVLASVLRNQEADALISSNHTKTWSLPAATDTLVGRLSTDTLTNKSISGTTNTLSALPIAVQTNQYVVTPYPSGSITAFTLSPTPPASGVGVVVYLDGLLLQPGAGLDYTISGATLTMTTAPSAGQNLYVVYSSN